MRTPLRERPLPDTGRLERDLVEASRRRFVVGRRVEGEAWARLLHERHRPEVDAIIGATVAERSEEWRSMVQRAIERGEVPPGTDARILLEFIRAIVDARSSSPRLDRAWLILAVRTVLVAARAGTLVRGRGRARPRGEAAAS